MLTVGLVAVLPLASGLVASHASHLRAGGHDLRPRARVSNGVFDTFTAADRGHDFYGNAPMQGATSALLTKNNYEAVRRDLKMMMDNPSWDDGSLAPTFIRLAWHSSGTYDATSGTGGSNGAGMRFSTEAADPENAGLEAPRAFLEPVKRRFPWISCACEGSTAHGRLHNGLRRPAHTRGVESRCSRLGPVGAGGVCGHRAHGRSQHFVHAGAHGPRGRELLARAHVVRSAARGGEVPW